MSDEKKYTQASLDEVCASLRYRLAQAEVEKASAEHEAADYRVDRARVHCRLAELRSQHEPLATLVLEMGIKMGTPEYDTARLQLYRAAFYALHGRITAY